MILVENVPDFEKWVLYPAWRDALRRLGYAVSPHLVDAADHGVPQNRQRLFLVCTRSRRPRASFASWPTPASPSSS